MPIKNYTVYNLDSSVGKYGVNQSLDVMLVQYMLSRISKTQGLPLPPPAKPIMPDGIYTPAMDEWILWFQKSVRHVGKPIATDGRIDPMPNDPYSTKYTMMHLNGSFRKRFRKEHDALETDPAAPEPLRAKFRSDEAV